MVIPKPREYLVPALAALSLLTACWFVSAKKVFWNDELYSYYLLSDPSFRHMLGAFHDRIHNAPPLYYVLGWVWSSGLGSTPLSLRFFSSAMVGLATLVTWHSLRCVYDFRAAMIGALTVFCSSTLIFDQNVEARMYGMFLFSASLLVAQFQTNNLTTRTTHGLFLANACVHGAIVQTHLFGSLYSGAFLIAQTIVDRRNGIFRTKLYVAIVLSWITLILYLPSFFNQAEAGSPRFWLPKSSISDFIHLLIVTAPALPLLALVSSIVLLSAVYALYRHWDYKALLQTQNPRVNSEKYLLIIAFTFLVVPLVVFAISYIKPLFLDRYLIPTTLVWAIVIAAITQRMMVPSSVEICSASSALANCPLDTCRSCLVLLVLVVSILYPLWGAKTFSPENIPGSNDEKFGYENLPMVVQLSHQFLPRLFYSARPNRYFFVLDWPSAVDEKSGLFPPQEYKHLEALKRQYPQIFGNVVSANKFLETNKQFLVLTNRDYNRACPSESQSKYWGDNIQCPRWVADRLITDAAYRIRPIGEIGSQVLLLVERVLK